MTAAFIATLVIAIILIVVLGVRERSRLRALQQARKELAAATDRAEGADQQRAEAETSAQERIAAMEALAAEKETATHARLMSAEAARAELSASSSGQIRALEIALREVEAERQRLEEAATIQAAGAAAASARLAELEAAGATERSALPPFDDSGDPGWRLLLARVERQWADVVNAGPDERGVLDGPRGRQLAQAVQRDLERLREEVGVQTTMASLEPVSDDGALTRLLAVGEAVALLAYHSEQVVVDLREPAMVSGQDWTGDDDARRRLEQLTVMATDAGLHATVEVVDHSVRFALGMVPADSTP